MKRTMHICAGVAAAFVLSTTQTFAEPTVEQTLAAKGTRDNQIFGPDP
jgi:hypothetical protein